VWLYKSSWINDASPEAYADRQAGIFRIASARGYDNSMGAHCRKKQMFLNGAGEVGGVSGMGFLGSPYSGCQQPPRPPNAHQPYPDKALTRSRSMSWIMTG